MVARDASLYAPDGRSGIRDRLERSCGVRNVPSRSKVPWLLTLNNGTLVSASTITAAVTDVEQVEDVLADMPGLDQVHADFAPGQQETPLPSDLSDVAGQVLEHITGYGQDLDEISTRVRQSAHATSSALVELELAGFVRQGGDGYIRAS